MFSKPMFPLISSKIAHLTCRFLKRLSSNETGDRIPCGEERDDTNTNVRDVNFVLVLLSLGIIVTVWDDLCGRIPLLVSGNNDISEGKMIRKPSHSFDDIANVENHQDISFVDE